MAEIIFTSILAGGGASALVVWLFKTWVSNRIKNSISHEYAVLLERHKAELQSNADLQLEKAKNELKTVDRVNESRWKIKHDTCLLALDIVDAHFSQQSWSGAPSAEVQEPPSIRRVRRCYNRLAVACDSPEVLDAFRKCIGVMGPITADVVVDLRQAIRRELNFGKLLNEDRKNAWIARVSAPASTTTATTTSKAD